MYIGHFGVAFAARAGSRRVPLLMLFVAACWSDLLMLVLLALGVEHLRIQPGITVVNSLDLYDYPFSHGLVSNIAWAALIGFGWYLWKRDKSGSWLLAGVAMSHWLLDFLTHRPDLPLFSGDPKVGLGLWNHWVPSLIVEGMIFIVAIGWYLYSTKARSKWAHFWFWLFVVYCLATWLPDALGLVQSASDSQSMLFMLPLTLILLFWVYWIDRTREKSRIV
jgi:membrane-bound metal-dependent hydrolase YbcI (DUF457 family)